MKGLTKIVDHVLLFDAVSFATEAHSGQFRRGTLIPYITHPLNVGRTLINCGCELKVVIGGILHDTIEDTLATKAILAARYGCDIADIVEGASEPNRADTWEDRKKETIDHLLTAPLDTLSVACADKHDNMMTLKEQLAIQGPTYRTNFNSNVALQHWYYSSLASIFTERLIGSSLHTVAEEYAALVEENFGGL